MPPVVAAAGIAAAAGLAGGVIQSKASKGAAQTQADLAREALEEQKRVYELESKKEQDRYDYDRNKTVADENRVRASRSGAFGGFGADLSSLSKGYVAPLGMSAEQSQGMMDARNAGFPAGGMQGSVTPVAPDMGTGPGPMASTATDPTSPTMGNPDGWRAKMSRGGAMGSTVWLQSPDGKETMEVSLQEAPMMLAQGARLIPTPTGGQ